MCPPAPAPPTNIGLYWTDEELFTSLDKFACGSPLPDNVIADINPFQYMPANLPDGIWYFVRSEEKRDTAHGFWKAKGHPCEIFKSSSLTGWRTTLEFFEGQTPHGRRTNWIMQEYKITRKGPFDQRKPKDFSSLCRVFLTDGHNVHNLKHDSKHSGADFTRTNHFHSIPLTAPNTDRTSGQGSTSKSQAKDTDNLIVPLAVPETNVAPPQENLHELDILRGDYLELNDLVDLESPSSSDNSSCVSLSSNECFDSLALLQDLDDEPNQDLHDKGSNFKFSVSEAARPNEVVLHPATLGSLVSGSGSKSRGELAQLGSEHAVKKQKADRRNEGKSASCNARASSSGSQNLVSKGDEKALGRIKKIKKNYLCCMPF